MAQTNLGYAVKLGSDDQAPLSSKLILVEKPILTPRAGQILVQMLASPVNPSDLVFLQGNYGLAPVEGSYAGFEGCGLVIQANAGLYGKWLIGKRVALSAQPGLDGCWSKYVVTRASLCLPLRKEISDSQGATLIVNPLTAICLVQKAVKMGAKAVIINAAASQVGKGVIRYAKLVNLKVIAVVRSTANVATLEKLGADCVIHNDDETFIATLKTAVSTFKPTVFFDAVAAQDTAVILRAMPANSTAIVYGRLSESRSRYGGEYGVADVIFRGIKIEGFWLANHLRSAKPWQLLALSNQVQRLFCQGIFNTDIYGTFDFDQFPAALDHYADHKSDGKVILVP